MILARSLAVPDYSEPAPAPAPEPPVERFTIWSNGRVNSKKTKFTADGKYASASGEHRNARVRAHRRAKVIANGGNRQCIIANGGVPERLPGPVASTASTADVEKQPMPFAPAVVDNLPTPTHPPIVVLPPAPTPALHTASFTPPAHATRFHALFYPKRQRRQPPAAATPPTHAPTK